ncbi:MAG: DNA polymerase III subunit delta' C-terminal domain-containing protein [Coriobacteriales bacterium]|nr:DNA polymerase III subunit delta' C-terminal domain-containing protein [Coriobacteriales bacterium]
MPIIPQSLRRIAHQPRVRDFLAAALLEGRLSHAYLFLGAPGAGMQEMADALAQCIVCPNGGDGTCDECVRVAHHTHPDVIHLSPAGVSGYLVDQVRELVESVSLTPVRANSKVYILDSADRLRGQAANALLKTIEEPPPGVLFILIARTADAMLPTIVSRCQQVPFRVVPQSLACELVCRDAGASEEEALMALSVVKTPQHAVEFLSSPSRREVRRSMVRVLGELERDDSWDVLQASRELVEMVQVSLGLMRGGKRVKREDAIKDEVKQRTQGQEDYYTAATLKQVEETVKRELTARERSGIMEMLAAAESFLRDVLVRCEGVQAHVTNYDVEDSVERIAAATSAQGVLLALDACHTAASNIAHNVTPQLALEVMLLAIKEALACQPSYR